MRRKIIYGLVFLVLIFGIFGGYHLFLRHIESQAMEQFDLSPNPQQRDLIPKKHQVIRILSIAGGGIYGILPANVLNYIEEKTGKPISESFDFIVGTSTGAIISVVLTLPNDQGKPKYTAKQLINLYHDRAKDVFYSPWYHQILTLDGMLGPRYLTGPRANLVNDLCGKTYFHQLLSNVVIPAYSLFQGVPILFYNWKVSDTSNDNYLTSSLLLGAISTPTIFPDMLLGSTKTQALIDGGIFANNPSIAGLISAMSAYPNKKYLLVSLGSGLIPPLPRSNNEIGWGLLQWGRILIPIIMDGASRLQNLLLTQLKHVFPQLAYYYYFNTVIDSRQFGLDDDSPAHIKVIDEGAKNLLEINRNKLDELVKVLKELDTKDDKQNFSSKQSEG